MSQQEHQAGVFLRQRLGLQMLKGMQQAADAERIYDDIQERRRGRTLIQHELPLPCQLKYYRKFLVISTCCLWTNDMLLRDFRSSLINYEF